MRTVAFPGFEVLKTFFNIFRLYISFFGLSPGCIAYFTGLFYNYRIDNLCLNAENFASTKFLEQSL